MYISEVAKQTGLTQKAIRLYEDRGIIPAPTRVGRYRTYTQADVENLFLVKEAKKLGLTLKQLEGYVIEENGANRRLDWEKIEQQLHSKKAELLAQIETLHETIKQIDACVREIKTCAIDY